MGRPINKRYLGEPTPEGDEIEVSFHTGAAVVTGWIVKQLGAKRFRCTDGTDTADCLLVDEDVLTEGQMSITVLDDAGAPKQLLKIAGRKVTVDTGESIGWNFSTSTTDGAVEMPEAGDAPPATPIAATAIVAATEYEIVTTGDTDFTLIGAADSNPGTIFTATGPGTGTGTVIPT